MAILNDLLVKGCSRFLQQIYVNDDMSVSGTLVLSKTQDAAGTANNGPALIVGGTRTAAHLELDNNKLMAKGSGTTTADLYINTDGGNVYLAKSGTTTQIQGLLKVQGNSTFTGTSTFTGAATFNGNLTANGTTALKNVSISSDLTVANNVKIEKTLTVEEEIRSPKWIIDNIANLGGEFVIAPTIVCGTSAKVVVAGPSSNQYTITVTDSSITSASFGGISWSNGSVVKVSGTINGVVFVSVNGTMSQALNTTTNTIQFKVSSNDITLTAGTYTGDKIKNLHIMMYKVGGTVPVGIFMTSYGANKYPYIEIYSGTGTNTPTTRLGYLNGLPAIVNNISPSGWGLYTNNGFFSGTIVSTSGQIGGWTLGTSTIYHGTLGATNGYMLNASGNSSTTINGTSRSSLTLAIGSKFAVGNDGTLYANGANVTNINAGNISAGSISVDRIKANVISAVNNGTGTINANKINVSAIKIGDLNEASTVISNASNGNSALTKVNYYNRRCLVGQSTSTNTNPWYKFASATITAQYVDKNIIFDVYNSGGYTASNIGTSMLGTLSAHFRAGGNIQNCESPTLTWSNRGNDITLANFVLAYKVTAKSKIDCELWVKCDRAYAGYEFAVRYDDSRAAHTETAGWDLYNTWAAGSQAAITSGYTQVASKDGDAARGVAEKYITSINNNGIRVHAESNPTKNYAQIDADGLDIIKGGVSVAQFGKSDDYGPSTRIGQESKTHITIAASESEDNTSGGYDHEKNMTGEIRLYNADGTKPNLKLYDSTSEMYDDGENSNHFKYEVVGIDLGENGNESVFDATGNTEISTGSRIQSVIEEDVTSGTRLEILTGNTQSPRSAGTYIESARQWSSNSEYNDLALIQTQVSEGGIQPSVYLRTISGLSSASLNIYATGSASGIGISADEIILSDNKGHSAGCYITYGRIGQDTATNANSYREVTVNFNHTYSSPPHVIATMYSTSTSPTMGSIQIAVASVTEKQAKIRIFNNTSGSRSPGFYWLAIG